MVEPPNSAQATNARPCSVCGVVGYAECLCSCSQCNSSVHLYCMRIFLKKVPEMWICEDCQSRNSDSTSHLNKRQKVKVSKVKFITADEAIKLTSGATKEPLVRTQSFGRSHHPSITASKKIGVDSNSFGPKSSPFKRIPDRSHRSHDRRVHFSVPAASPFRELKETRTTEGHRNQNVMDEHPIKSLNLASGPGDSIRKAGDAMCLQSFASSPSIPTESKSRNAELVRSPKSGTEHRSSKDEGEVVIKQRCSSPPLTPYITGLPETISDIGPATGKFSNKEPAKAQKFTTEQKLSHKEVEIKKEPCISPPRRASKPTDLPGAISDVSSIKSKFTDKDQVKDFRFPLEEKSSNRNAQMVIKKEPCSSSPETPCVPTDLPVPAKSKLRDQLRDPKSANEHRTPNREVESIVEKVSSMIPFPRVSTPDLPGANAVGMSSLSLSKTLQNNLSLSSTSRLHAVDATWKGSFRVLRTAAGRLYEGFQAHPPLIVHRKAYEFSKKMPAVLQFNFLPVSTLWMELFQDDPPDENDVGIYIFPSDVARASTDFPSLLEAMDMNDMLMKIDIGGVELLIFTSKCLHVKSDSKLPDATRGGFLWGLFRPMKDTSDKSGSDDLPPGFHEKRWLKEGCKLNQHN